MPLCPHCNGAGTSLMHVRSTVASGFRRLPCSTCRGTGAITPEHVARIAAGQALRAARLATLRTLRAEAARLGITPSELSRREQGQE